MLLVIHSAMRLRSLSACFWLYTDVHPSAITSKGRDGVENRDEEENKAREVGGSQTGNGWNRSSFIFH